MTKEQMEHPMHPNVKIIGIGGGGIHTIDYMIDCGMQGEDFIAIDRDSQELKLSKAHTQILIGENLHTGWGIQELTNLNTASRYP